MTVGEHDGELPEATQTTAELQKQIDGLQGQITDIHRTQGTTELKELPKKIPTSLQKSRA
ncbi:hypothetical protein DY000_02007013 [Brassica cretica]|uniref:Uncharacterized protein n=1 Tax=Brassica cretica TaxID=69181 RepID=A0ABQ7CCS6_BRACR|nr:hypothetical protein DY000_02007013 [Brassica cretica]